MSDTFGAPFNSKTALKLSNDCSTMLRRRHASATLYHTTSPRILVREHRLREHRLRERHPLSAGAARPLRQFCNRMALVPTGYQPGWLLVGGRKQVFPELSADVHVFKHCGVSLRCALRPNDKQHCLNVLALACEWRPADRRDTSCRKQPDGRSKLEK